MKDNYEILIDPNKYRNEIYSLDSSFYDKKYLWPIEYQLDVYERNKDSFIMVGYNGKLVGYLNYLCITKNKYDSIKKSNVIVDEYDLNDIVPFKKGDNYLNINSTVIAEEHQNGECIKLINNHFINKLKEYELANIHIKGIEGTAISESGQKYLQNLGFKLEKKLDDNNYLYFIEDDGEVIYKKISDKMYK